MKNMKKYALIPVVIVSVVSFSGCFQSANVEQEKNIGNSGKSNSQENININKNNTPVDNGKSQSNGDISQNMNSSQNQASDPGDNLELVKKYSGAVIKTNYGDIKVKFYNEDAPTTVNNFLKLAQSGFYDGTKFHRVIFDFMIQGGDPNSKDNDWSNDGQGGPGYTFADEFNNHKLTRGSLAMANSGPNTNGSQFFIVTKSATPWLDGKHTNFGELIEGYDTVVKIEALKVDANAHPLQDAVIKNIELLEK